MKRTVTILMALVFLPVLLGAGADRPVKRTGDNQAQRPAVVSDRTVQPEATVVVPAVEAAIPEVTAANSAPNYNLDWWSINGGGDVAATSASYQMGMSVGQSVAGAASSASYGMGIGFWYGAASASCPITMTGDVNTNGSITSADIIYLVGYVFKGGAAPLPCAAAGDVNCNGSVTSADIIYLVGYVFKGGPPPCDVCTMIPGSWSCP